VHDLLGNRRWQSQENRLEFGLVSAIDSNGRTIWIADAHRGDGKRFVVRADEKLTAFLELESAIRVVTSSNQSESLRGPPFAPLPG